MFCSVGKSVFSVMVTRSTSEQGRGSFSKTGNEIGQGILWSARVQSPWIRRSLPLEGALHHDSPRSVQFDSRPRLSYFGETRKSLLFLFAGRFVSEDSVTSINVLNMSELEPPNSRFGRRISGEGMPHVPISWPSP